MSRNLDVSHKPRIAVESHRPILFFYRGTHMRAPLTPDTDALPFLVVHGGWFWIVLMIAFALAMAGMVRISRHALAVVRARSVVAQQRAAVINTLSEGKAIVAGRWHRDSITVGDERVELGEDRRIVLGSRRERIADDADVIVSGELARVATTRPVAAGYREDAGTWRILGAEVYAVRPRVRAHPLPWVIRLLGFGLALMSAYATLRIVGNKLVDRVAQRNYRGGNGRPLFVSELDAISIAASLPGSRDNALIALANALEEHPYRDDESVRRQIGLDQIIHGACGYLPRLQARPEEQLAMARRCHYDRAVFDILTDIGEYEQAWNSKPLGLEWPHRVGMVAIALGKWTDAAAEAEKLAALNDQEVTRKTEYREYRLVDALRYRCLAQWFRTLAGDGSGADKLRALATASGNLALVCAPMVAQTLPAEQRAAYLRDALGAAVPEDAGHLRSAYFVASEFLWLEGEDDAFTTRDPFDINSSLGNAELAVGAWLAPFGLERWRAAKDPRQLSIALGGVVLREVHRGDFDAARRAAQEAAETVRGLDDEYRQSVVRSWFSLIALREGQRELPAREHVDSYMDALKLRRGDDAEYGMHGYPESCNHLLSSAVSTAQRGDGRPLANAMQSCSVSSTFALRTLIGVLPLVRQGRNELATALRSWTDGFGVGSFEPFKSIAYAAARRDIARFTEDEESTDRWDQMAKRFVAPLDDPTRTFALVLWHD
jgi:hypothetical protein